MLCPVCRWENEEGNHHCINCGVRLLRRKTRKNGESNGGEGETPLVSYRLAWIAFRCSKVALIPIVGLVMGPVSLILGIIAWWQSRMDPWDKGIGPAGAAMWLGLLTTLTMWLGLFFIVKGLWPGHGIW